MDFTILKRQGFNGDDGDDDNDGLGYSNVRNDLTSLTITQTDWLVDGYRHQMGFPRRDPATVPALVRWRLLPRATEDKERLAPFGIS